jgi:hypothetical protein
MRRPSPAGVCPVLQTTGTEFLLLAAQPGNPAPPGTSAEINRYLEWLDLHVRADDHTFDRRAASGGAGSVRPVSGRAVVVAL